MSMPFRIRCVRGRICNRVFINDQELDPKPSQAIKNHSPDGFNWGYGGSGPAQTALAICLHIFQDAEVALKIYQEFKFKYVATWQGDDVETTISIEIFNK